jgi:chromate transporter
MTALPLLLVAVGGGNALIPALHEEAVTSQHWLSDASFTELVGLSQAAPGPNMLLMPLIGWRTAGLAGAAVALVAFLLPSSTVAIFGARFLARHECNAAVVAFKWALRPVGGGLMLSSAIVLIGTAARTLPRPSAAAPVALALIAAAVATASLRLKLNPLVFLTAAALIGAIAYG